MCLTECLNRDDFPERLGKNIAQESKKSTFGDVRRLKTSLLKLAIQEWRWGGGGGAVYGTPYFTETMQYKR